MDSERRNLLREWRLAVDKNSDRFWRNPAFREAYATELEFYNSCHRRTVESDVLGCVEDLLENPRPRDNLFGSLERILLTTLGGKYRQLSWSSQGSNASFNRSSHGGLSVRLLSLGCGPGIDVLAIVSILALHPHVASIECVGVDQLSHPIGGLINELEKLADQNPDVLITFKSLSGIDISDFVQFCNGINCKFDLVSARYINAIDKLPLFYGPAPGLVGNAGRVLLLDNHSWAIDGLARSGGYVENCRLRRLTGRRHGRIYLVFQWPVRQAAGARVRHTQGLD